MTQAQVILELIKKSKDKTEILNNLETWTDHDWYHDIELEDGSHLTVQMFDEGDCTSYVVNIPVEGNRDPTDNDVDCVDWYY